MCLVYMQVCYGGKVIHKYFHSLENAKAYARMLREEDQSGTVELEEIQTED